MSLLENVPNATDGFSRTDPTCVARSLDVPLKWHLMKRNRCPKCSKDFSKGLEVTEGGYIDDMERGDMRGKMMHHPCGLMITKEKYLEIISNQVVKHLNESY